MLDPPLGVLLLVYLPLPSTQPVIVEPGQEASCVPIRGVPIPVTVAPDEVGLVAGHQVIQLGHRHLLLGRNDKQTLKNLLQRNAPG